MRIFLVRHAQSEGNHNKEIHKTVANHAIELTEEGHRQAKLAAEFLANYIHKKLARDANHDVRGYNNSTMNHWVYPKFRMWVSPFTRTRQTAEHIYKELSVLGTNLSCVKLNGFKEYANKLEIDKKEHVGLVEIDPGLFDGIAPEERPVLFPKEWELFHKVESQKGRYWARYPGGESVYDVALRCHQSFGTFHRDYQRHGIENLIIVSHGTTTRAFTQMWLGLPWEWYEEQPNPGNTWIRLIEGKEDKGFIYQPHFGDKVYDGRGK